MRFKKDAYDKVFPRKEKQHIDIETAVSTFTPTTDKIIEEEKKTVDVVEEVVEEVENSLVD